jgi:hypothetical protein
MPRQSQRRSEAATVQGSLFPGIDANAAEASHVGWVDQLLNSQIFAAQRRMAGRRAPDDPMVAVFLRLLDQHHDRISRHVLIQSIGQPEIRLRGILVGLQRLFNVEGYQVVAVDEATGTIELNRQLLAKQFELPSCLR